MLTVICVGVISAASQPTLITSAGYIIKEDGTSTSPKVGRTKGHSTCLFHRTQIRFSQYTG